MKYKMQREFIYGWDDTEFGDDEQPIIYDTKEEAEKALQDYIEETNQEHKAGNLEEPYQDDCRIFEFNGI